MFEDDELDNNEGILVHYTDESAPHTISGYLKNNTGNSNVILCIGTDRYIGDCLGPIVGTLLSKLDIWCPIYGTLENPVHAINLRKVVCEIKHKYPKHSIIAVDACLGTKEYVGMIHARQEPIYPGKGVGKKLPSVGDISIIGIVDSAESEKPNQGIDISDEMPDCCDTLPLHNIRLNFVMKMAETITKGVYEAYKVNNNKKHGAKF